jgi:hypothetical protein
MAVSFFDRRWITIRFDESVHAIWVEWKAYAEGEDYRSALDAMLELLQQKKSSRMLADCRLLGPITQADQLWTNQNWQPRSATAGLRWVAIVSPRAAVARLSIKQMVTRSTSSGVEMVTNHFDDMELARAWLLHPTKTS